MSEPMFPSPDGGSAAPVDAAPVPAAPGNKKVLLALGGIGAAVVVGAGAFFLLGSGGSGDATPAAAPVAPVPAASAPAKPVVKPVVIRPAGLTVTSRDPFKALFPPATVTTGTSASGSGTTTGTTSGSTGTTTPTTTGSGTTKTVTLAVSTIDPVAGTATVTVDKKPYAVAVGKTFGQYFTVYSVFNEQCVGILYGDQSIPVCIAKPQNVSP